MLQICGIFLKIIKKIEIRVDLNNNLPILIGFYPVLNALIGFYPILNALIGFYPILNANALSGLRFRIERKIAIVVDYYQKTLKGL
jgi:hypothetical protein